LIRQYSFLLDKTRLAPVVTLEGARIQCPASLPAVAGAARAAGPHGVGDRGADSVPPMATAATGEMVEVPLIRLAWARSGDKGDTSNVGVIARRPQWLPLL